MPATSTFILLLLREGWYSNTAMPPSSGKRDSGRGCTGHSPTHRPAGIVYRPRPHIKVTIKQQTFDALIDTEAEVSCLNLAATKKIFPDIKSRLQPAAGVKFADNSRGKTLGSIKRTIFINAKTYQHQFLVLPRLETPIIIGVDLWGRTRLNLTPSGLPTKGRREGTSGSISQSTDDDERTLKEFLAT